ncbi:polyprenyl diphosphate synthase [Buchnera aphidicola (Mindarus keteleerifoliae)]|uniref:polyprenyl diphosphate synthase n=1 Tax=Buchnera aphidicola TaxID=9 RepID=UPI0031B6C2FC
MKRKNYPLHIAIIMDGNGRWAKKKGKSRVLGHKEGVKAVYRSVKFALINNIKVLTLYAFSNENWLRSPLEVSNLMILFEEILKKDSLILNKYNIKLKILGNKKKLNSTLQNQIKISESLTSENNGLRLNIAINYGGRQDILSGLKKIMHQILSRKLNLNDIKEDSFASFLSTKNLPPVDLLIRTGGNIRISNFLLWEIAYSELYFTKVFWPDFDQVSFSDAINQFKLRKRNFGK